MTTYASKDELKSYLGMSLADTSKDSLLDIYLASAEAYINGYLGVDTVLSSDFTERVKFEGTISTLYANGYEFYLRKRPVTAIKKVNGITYTGELGKNHIIEWQRKVTFIDLSLYLATANYFFDTVEIVYTAGYQTCPADIKLAELMLAGATFAEGGANIAYDSYKIGDESVTFKNPKDQTQFERLLKPYKTFL